MEISKCYLLLMPIFLVFKKHFDIIVTEEVCQRIKAISIKDLIKKYFWKALGIIIVLIDSYYLYLLILKLNLLQNEAGYNLSNHDVPMSICDIFKLNLSILFLHFYLKYFMYRHEWESYKWLENFIIVGSYTGVFIIVLSLSCTGLIIIPNTTFERIAFVISIVLSYFAYCTACITDWFDKYIYSECYTYTSTVNHVAFKDRKYLIITNLETRWYLKKLKEITKEKKKIVQSAPQDPRTSQSLDCDGEYLQSTRIVQPDTYYNQPDTFGWGTTELNEYSNSFRQYTLIPL